MRKPRYYSTKRVFHVGTVHAAQPLLLAAKKWYRSNVSLFPGGRLAVFVDTFDFRSGGSAGVLLAASGQRTRMLLTAPPSQAGPYGTFRVQTHPP